jgi:manganese efflux pump family protein
LLIGTGVYGLVQAVRSRRGDDGEHEPAASLRTGRLLVTGIALSIDNLAVGFALGTYRVSLLLAAVTIGAVSVCLSLAGLELGNRLGVKTGERVEYISGLVLIGVGVALATGVF